MVELWRNPQTEVAVPVEQRMRLHQRKSSHVLLKRAVPGDQPTPTSSPQCESFELVDAEQKMLYSPGYPGNYPNNTDCHVVLEGE